MEAFIEDVNTRSGRFKKRLAKHDYTQLTEEATKTAFVLPFIEMLGYDTWDIDEVFPEFTADIGTKKGEKVDYALMQEGTPTILIECKSYGTNLRGAPVSQLTRYFGVTSAHFGILTDGIDYLFYTANDVANVMDAVPSFVFNMLDHTAQDVKTLYTYHRIVFDVDEAMDIALCARRRTELDASLRSLLENPTDDFVVFLARTVYTNGRISSKVREEFAPLVREVCRSVVDDEVERRLNEALAAMPKVQPQEDAPPAEPAAEEDRERPSAAVMETAQRIYDMLKEGSTAAEVALALSVGIRTVRLYVGSRFFPDAPLRLKACAWDDEGKPTDYKWEGILRDNGQGD